jgi:hypothetical protein
MFLIDGAQSTLSKHGKKKLVRITLGSDVTEAH